jgi:hypothetical protein
VDDFDAGVDDFRSDTIGTDLRDLVDGLPLGCTGVSGLVERVDVAKIVLTRSRVAFRI